MPISFTTKVTKDDMFKFNMYHTYHSVHGIAMILLAILVFVVATVTIGRVAMVYTVAYYVLGLFFLFYTPLSLKANSAVAVENNPILKNELHYTLEDEEIRIHTDVPLEEDEGKIPEGAPEDFDPQTAKLPWEAIYKVVKNKDNLLIYSNRVNAYVIPVRDIEDIYPQIKELMEQKLESHRLSLA